MDNKNKITTEELEKQYNEAKKVFELLGEQLQKQRQEEEDRRVAELAAKRTMRKKEVNEARKNFIELRNAYIRDYGSYDYTTDNRYDSLFDIFGL